MESNHLSTVHTYSQIQLQDLFIEINGVITQTDKPNHHIIVSDKALSSANKRIVKDAAEDVMKVLPATFMKYDIDIQKIGYDPLQTQPEDLWLAIRQWLSSFKFKLKNIE